ncbi:helix-turn-helix domain-containing protein [Embleya sp. NBC_00888]|uniref:helix-turn-helix domain-containing protein n=1 Tax=Embleya sp. NBC_00888 TaxID=2975960 RepID=UPI003865A444|nr:helix-turn-helix domain-containing protein [Embleya sp. NBC_00888]
MAAQIREHRTRAGMSVTELADVVGYSKASMSRFETCDSPVPEELCPKLDAAFGTNGLFTALFEMLRGVRFPDRYLEYMSLENDAFGLREWAGFRIPGLLQTPAYARAVFREADRGATEEEIEARVAARMDRRAIFDKDPSPYFAAILDESVLRRWIGGPIVMAEQLAALLPMMDHEYGTARVLPLCRGEFGLSEATQIVIELEDGTSLIYVEGSASGQILEDPDVVTMRKRTYDRVSAYALTPRESAAMIRAAIKEYEACTQSPI